MRRVLVTTTTVASALALAGGLAMNAQASPARPARAADTETFRLISTLASSRRVSTLATGHFTDGGYTVPGALNPVTLQATGRMVFPRGSFDVYEQVTSQNLPLPTRWCLFTETIRGSYTLGAGTGAYQHISGSGQFVTRITGVIHKSNGECGGGMIVYQEITNASGPVRG